MWIKWNISIIVLWIIKKRQLSEILSDIYLNFRFMATVLPVLILLTVVIFCRRVVSEFGSFCIFSRIILHVEYIKNLTSAWRVVSSAENQSSTNGPKKGCSSENRLIVIYRTFFDLQKTQIFLKTTITTLANKISL